ncbi:U6 snRNP-associated protein Lsm7 [Basidiobolus ranarum]|uniref:U6 snRNP-associated protein Lsm7 n=1 Tax=Basidiobolus ranarum TaxID=34480 RepID=A0ABR2WWH8_9FUNG
MSDRGRGRGNDRGGRGGRGGNSNRGNRGGSGSFEQKPKKESILDLGKYMDKQIRVKFSGGREVIGSLKGYDPLLNLVLDETKECIRDPENPNRLLDQTRNLGLIVCRGPSVVLISPLDGSEEIANPFI